MKEELGDSVKEQLAIDIKDCLDKIKYPAGYALVIFDKNGVSQSAYDMTNIKLHVDFIDLICECFEDMRD